MYNLFIYRNTVCYSKVFYQKYGLNKEKTFLLRITGSLRIQGFAEAMGISEKNVTFKINLYNKSF